MDSGFQSTGASKGLLLSMSPRLHCVVELRCSGKIGWLKGHNLSSQQNALRAVNIPGLCFPRS
jgi:hypothetical protein